MRRCSCRGRRHGSRRNLHDAGDMYGWLCCHGTIEPVLSMLGRGWRWVRLWCHQRGVDAMDMGGCDGQFLLPAGHCARYCTKPRPACGGAGCEGANSRTLTTQLASGWTQWSAWSATCGAKFRTRTCQTPSCASFVCQGRSREDLRGSCCPVHGEVSAPPVDPQCALAGTHAFGLLGSGHRGKLGRSPAAVAAGGCGPAITHLQRVADSHVHVVSVAIPFATIVTVSYSMRRGHWRAAQHQRVGRQNRYRSFAS